jgi:hypothetical protein
MIPRAHRLRTPGLVGLFAVGAALLLSACGGASQPRGCGMPGEPGNEKGVGKYCTPAGDECRNNSFAVFCTVTFVPDAEPYCTNSCTDDSQCGADAYCSGSGKGARGCVPAICGGPPSKGDGGM